MQEKLDKAREHALRQILLCSEVLSSDARNWATAYAILTDKKIAELSVREWVGSDGRTHAQDAYGKTVEVQS